MSPKGQGKKYLKISNCARHCGRERLSRKDWALTTGLATWMPLKTPHTDLSVTGKIAKERCSRKGFLVVSHTLPSCI